ncbi:MAG: methylated-DNA--[protein]-cysteine S-methyltransferase [Actinomycetota bacterium]|nr:methylated-DNA--[protein]-cysteine S-methyltransferase [Actinomycetota bacterium]
MIDPATTAEAVSTTVGSPVGTITLVAVDGALTGLYLHEQRHAPPPETWGRPDPAAFGQVTAQLEAYFRGELRSFDVPLAPRGTPFQQRVWTALRGIPYGKTTTYGELAARIGAPGAARAVGLANGRNPIGIIVPCHRVVGSSGRLVGYAGGLERKQHLLDLERGAPALL